ncbi:MAG: BglG family transcription antiterminator [Vallitaleaceae bacterium]|nr:BglG family transcription antiterminator [Vallitaleaceae bacterium]
MLTSRMKKVLAIILKAEDYITLAQIAQEVQVSTRTLLRELDEAKSWVEQQKATLEVRKGRGLFLHVEDERKEELLQLLWEEKGAVIYSPSERQMILRAKLLRYSEPTKLYVLTHELQVTESTIASDLLQVEEWFTRYEISVVKKPGFGILLEGDERAIRKAIVGLIYEHFHVVDLIKLIALEETEAFDYALFKNSINQAVLDLLDESCLIYVKAFLKKLEEEMGFRFVDNAYIALVIRFSMTLKRNNFFGLIHIPAGKENDLRKDEIFQRLCRWAQETQNPFAKLPENELLFLALHIKGTKLSDLKSAHKASMIEDFRVIQLVKDFIYRVEYETGIYLADNEKLILSLVKHLRTALYRMKADLDIINPLVSDIKETYPKLFATVKNCAVVIEEKEKVSIPEDEIAYLSTYIGAFIHKRHREEIKKYKVLVACMYGIGSSQLLVSQIEEHFANMEIVQVLSALDIAEHKEMLKKVDLLLTTVPIQIDEIPVVVVNQILKEDDILAIKNALQSHKPRNVEENKRQSLHLKEKLLTFQEYSKVILELLHNFRYDEAFNISSLEEVIRLVSKNLSTTKQERELLEKAFRDREEKGSTILGKKGMILLHCRANIEKGVSFQIIKAQKPFYMHQALGKIEVDTVIVMVGPLQFEPKFLEILSEISRNIISSSFSEVIKNGSQEEVFLEFSVLLDEFYKLKVLS